jgi:hypothetical protein
MTANQKFLRFSFILLLLLPSLLYSQGWQWGHSFGGSGSDFGEGMVLDASGNVYTIGMVNASVNFGSGANPTHGSTDALVTKHNISGQLTWFTLLGGTGADDGTAITLDSAGNIYVTGAFHNTIICGPDTLVAQGEDIFIAKLNPAGQIVWGRKAGSSTTTSADLGYAVSYSYIDNTIVISGYVQSVNSTFGPYVINSSSAVLAKLDVNGNWLWAYPVGSGTGNLGNDIAIDPSGDIYLTGSLAAIMYLKRYTSAGAVVWTTSASTSSSGKSIALDQSGNIYVSGTHSTGISFGAYYIPPPSNGAGGFWVKYNSSGTDQFAQGLSSSSINCSSIAVNSSGDIFVAGSFNGSLYSDTTFLFDIYLGNTDGYVAKYNAAGALVWMKQVGTSQNDILYGLTLYGTRIYITGYVSGTPNASFGSITFPSYGGPDVILAQFNDCSPPYTSVTPGFYLSTCEGDTIHLESTTTSSSYTYQWQGNGAPLSNGTGTSIDIIGTALNSGAYAVQISTAGCTYTSHYVSVTFNPLPVVNITRTSYGTTCNNDSVRFSATNLPLHTYQWLLNNSPIPGATNRIYMCHANGIYSVIVTSNYGCTDTTIAGSVTMGNYPNIIAWGDTTVCQGATVPMYASGDATSYAWTPTLNVSFPNTPTPNATPSVTTTYTVIGTTVGCHDTAYVTVTVNPLPAQPTISFNNPTLSCSPAYYAYQWYYNGSPITGATNQTYNPTLNGNYTVLVFDSLGCSRLSAIFQVLTLDASVTVANEQEIRIYPQPLTESSLVQFSSMVTHGEITLYSVTGSEIRKIEINNTDHYILHRENLSQGIYFIKLVTEGGVSTTRLLVE